MKTETDSPTQLSSLANDDKQKTLDNLIAAQGVAQTARFEILLGAGSDLWKDDEEFERFLDTLKTLRQEKV